MFTDEVNSLPLPMSPLSNQPTKKKTIPLKQSNCFRVVSKRTKEMHQRMKLQATLGTRVHRNADGCEKFHLTMRSARRQWKLCCATTGDIEPSNHWTTKTLNTRLQRCLHKEFRVSPRMWKVCKVRMPCVSEQKKCNGRKKQKKVKQ